MIGHCFRRRPKTLGRWCWSTSNSLFIRFYPLVRMSSSTSEVRMSDQTPLLPGGPSISTPTRRTRILTSILVPLLLIAAVIFVSVRGDGVPKDPLGKAKYWMNTYVPV